MRVLVFSVLLATHFGVGCDCTGTLSKPTVTIETPEALAPISKAQAANFGVSGRCSDIGQPVELSGAVTLSVACEASGWSASLDLTAVPDGEVTIRANHVAAVGRAADEATRTFIKDATAPEVHLDGPAASTPITVLTEHRFEVTGRCSENGRPVRVSGAASTSVDCLDAGFVAAVDVSAAADGPVTLQVDHDDAFGNAAPADSRTWSKLSNVPAVTIEHPATNTFINAATVGAFAVDGLCTEAGQPVVVSGGALGDFACSGSTWSGPLNFTSAPEGATTITVNHSDLSGVMAPAVSRAFIKDTITPTISGFSVTTPTPTSLTTLALATPTLSEPIAAVCLLENSTMIGNCAWQAATTVPSSVTVSASPGVKRITLYVRDVAGNESLPATTAPVTLDTGAPTVTLQSPNGGDLLVGGSSVTIRWSCTDTDLAAAPITLEYQTSPTGAWVTIATMQANTGTATWALPTLDSATMRVRVSAIDLSGNVGSAISAGPFTIDSTPPVFTVGQFRLNGGLSPALSPFTAATFTATETGAPINAYCLKTGSTAAPTVSDACWVSVTQTASLSPTANVRLGFLPGAYTVYGWARNAVGLVSGLTASGAGTFGTDSQTITYTPLPPPALTGVTASASDTVSNLTAPSGTTVYVKWNASSTGTLAPQPISIFYTTDDTSWSQVVAATANAQGAGCTLTGGATGCYTWVNGAPTSGYFRVRVGAVDTTSRRSFRSTLPMNVGAVLKVLAGNTDPGTGGSAEAAAFVTFNQTSSYSDMGSLVVTPQGMVYFDDSVRGLLSVDPSDGVQRVLIPKTGVRTDGTVPGTATLRDPTNMTIDPQGRLLFFDYDRIRRYDPTTGMMTTLIGGGASSAATVAATSLRIMAQASDNGRRLLVVAGDGKIYFQSEDYNNVTLGAGYAMRVYDPSNSMVTSLRFSGQGDTVSATQDITQCEGLAMAASLTASGVLERIFVSLSHGAPGCPGSGQSLTLIDPATLRPVAPYTFSGYSYASGTVTGANGRLYFVTRVSPSIRVLNVVTGALDLVAGTGTSGTCADGTLATSCNVDPSDVYADRLGQVYFLERGRVRAIDSSNRVYTVMGSGLSSGDGQLATQARIGAIADLKLWSNAGTPTVVISDQGDLRIREFAIDGTIQNIAGNGSHGSALTTQPATSQPISYNGRGVVDQIRFQVDATTGTVYGSSRDVNYLSRLDRATGRWVDFVGGGATPYATADGLVGSSIDFSGYNAHALAFDGTRLMVHKMRFMAGGYDSFFKRYTVTNGTQSSLAGVPGLGGNTFSPDGTLGTAATVPYDYSQYSSGAWDSFGNRWVFSTAYAPAVIRSLPTGGSLGTVATLNKNAVAFAYRHDATNNLLYYCDDTGALNRYNVTTSSNTVLTPWPITKMKCTGLSLIYSAARSSLIFAFQQDGLGGVAEYLNP